MQKEGLYGCFGEEFALWAFQESWWVGEIGVCGRTENFLICDFTNK